MSLQKSVKCVLPEPRKKEGETEGKGGYIYIILYNVMSGSMFDKNNRDGKLMIQRVGHARRRCRAGLTCRLQARKERKRNT